MSTELARLAGRRAALVARCAQQRDVICAEVAALRSPFSLDAMRGQFAGNGKLKLALAGIALGLAVTRPRRLLALAGTGLSLWQTVRKVLPLIARP